MRLGQTDSIGASASDIERDARREQKGFLRMPSFISEESRWSGWCDSEYEEKKYVGRVERFLVPQLKRFGVRRVLEVGCGSGAGTIYLRERGLEAYGIDPCLVPDVTSHYDFLMQGKGQSLPFETNYFDLSFALEVIEHVGTEDGMLRLAENYQQERRAFVAELCRVTGKHIILSTPHKYFPIDEHARRDRSGQPGFRFHSPFERCFLSVSELQSLFLPAGFRLATFLDGSGYYELERVKRKLGNAGLWGARLLFRLSSNRILGRTFLNPHLFLHFERRP